MTEENLLHVCYSQEESDGIAVRSAYVYEVLPDKTYKVISYEGEDLVCEESFFGLVAAQYAADSFANNWG